MVDDHDDSSHVNGGTAVFGTSSGRSARMTIRTDETRAENSQLVAVDTSHWLDALLDRVPLRMRELATPPAGSNLKPVRGDLGLPFVGLGIHTVRYGPAFQIQLLRRH